MLTRILPAVLAILLCESFVHAGFMLGRGESSGGFGLSQPGASAMMDLLGSDQEHGRYLPRLYDADSGLSAVTPPSTSAGSVSVALADNARFPMIPGLGWRISIGNRTGPPTPVLGGLLKPS